MILISVIVPVFNNIIKDIERCIYSLHNENFQNKIEIIVIDDGSCSECSNALDEITHNYSNVKVFHQINKGVSNARNNGINYASGEYVTFVDADDVVSKTFISDAIDLIESANSNYDIIYGFVKYINSTDEKYLQNVNIQKKQTNCIILTEKERELLARHFFDLSVEMFRWNDNYVSRGSVARLVKRDLARLHKFNESLTLGEDAIWNLELLKFAGNICFVKRLWYYYIYNPKSATHQFNKKIIGQYENMLWNYLEYANNDGRKACLLNRTIQSSTELARGYFLKDDNFNNIFVASSSFNQLFVQAPWNQVLCFSYACQSGIRCVVKYLLVRMGIYLFVVKFKNLV